MPGFQDSAVIIILALLLFGPKKLPQLARQLGKLMADFRRASNEFRTQMEEELRIAEQADRQKEVARIEAAAAATVLAETATEPHEPPPPPSFASTDSTTTDPTSVSDAANSETSEPAAVPIATSGELSIMPPATGLPVAASATPPATPATDLSHQESEYETETLHG